MEIERLYENYSPIGDVIACICCMMLLVMIYTTLYYAREKKFAILKGVLHVILLGSFTNIIFYYATLHYTGNAVLIFALRDFYHICFMSCLHLFVMYIRRLMGLTSRPMKHLTNFSRAVFGIFVVLDLLSPLTKFGFYTENDLWYDTMVSPYNLFYLYAAMLLFILILVSSERMIQSVRTCLLITMGIIAVIMTVSAINNVNVLTSFTYLMPVIVVMILLHSKPYDDVTGAMNSDSFDSYLTMAMEKGTALDYIILKLNMHVIGEMPAELGKRLSALGRHHFKKALLFNIEHDLFALVIPKSEKNGNVEQKMEELLQTVSQDYEKYQIGYKGIGLTDMDFIKTGADLRDMIQYLLYTMDENTIKVTDDYLRRELRLTRTVRQALIDIEKANDINDPRVLAYCQPIRNMETGKFDTAEALMRLSLDTLNIVPPNIFIPLAEYYGHIHCLSRIILHKVCMQIRELEEAGYQFSRVSVNVAASEVRLPSFCEDILDIVKDDQVLPKHVGIEMTESQDENDFNIVRKKMQILRDQGMTIYLDDVGTGYSNLDRIVKYDIDVVKFDRFFLLEADRNSRVVPMIQHLSQAFKDLNYKLLFEGVENEDHEELCMNCGADYIQGFKYSRPVPIEQLCHYFEKG